MSSKERGVARDGEDKQAWHKRRCDEYADASFEKKDHASALRIAIETAREANAMFEAGDAEAAYVRLEFIGLAAYSAHAGRHAKYTLFLYYRCKAALAELQPDDQFAAKWAPNVAMVAGKMRELADALEYMGIDTTRDPSELKNLRWSDVARRFIDRDSDYERNQRKDT